MTERLERPVTFRVAVLPAHGNDAREVFLQADRALYQAKALGKNRACVSGED